MDNKKNRKYGAIISALNMLISILIGIIYTPFQLRLLGQSEYGIYCLAGSIVSYLAMLDMGCGNALIRFTARARAEKKDEKNINGMFFLFYSAIAVVAGIIGIFLIYNVESFFSNSFSQDDILILKKVLIVMVCNMVISFPASVFSSIVRSHEKFIFANFLNLLKNILSPFTMLIFLFMGYKSLALACISLVITIITTIINIYYCFNRINVSFGFHKFNKSFYDEVFFYSFYILINIIVDQLYSNTDKIILGKYCGTNSVAIYSVAVIFTSYFTQFSLMISSVFLPHISKLVVKKDGIKESSDLFLKIGRIQFIMLSFILVGYSVFGKEFIYLWSGADYYKAYYIALIVMIPAIIPLSQNIGISILQALNKHKIRSIMYLGIAFINLGISIPLSIKYGGIGAAIGTSIGNILGQILFMNWFYYTKINIDIFKYWRNSLLIVLKTIPVWCVFLVVENFIDIKSFKALIAKILFCIVIVSPYYYNIIFSKDERMLIKPLLDKIIRR